MSHRCNRRAGIRATACTIGATGRLVDASNATLFCSITGAGEQAQCVYKPVSGERALWDFPDGTLAGREVASYLLSQAAGLSVIPPTIRAAGYAPPAPQPAASGPRYPA